MENPQGLSIVILVDSIERVD